MIYQWKPCPHPAVAADTAGQVCEKLASEGKLTAKRLVEVSRPKNAPLHRAFEWDNTKAAALWREHEARNIINCLVQVQPASTGHDVVVRSFFTLDRSDPEYEPIKTILESGDKYNRLLAQALQELRTFTVKYRNIKELAPTVSQIEKTIFDLQQTIQEKKRERNE